MIARTPAPPYYAVVFTSQRAADTAGYDEMAGTMVALAQQQPGFLGFETAHKDIGITVSYWRDLDAIRQWKANVDHREAQRLGRERWYAAYRVRIAKVEREYGSLPEEAA